MAEHIHIDPELRGTLRMNEPMKRHVSWRAGGAAKQVYVPADAEDLALFLRGLRPDEPVCLVGLGSNLLVRDGGYPGTVVLMHNSRGAMRLTGELVRADAGVASPKLARFAAARGLAGAEFLAGVPGTVGGALAMNAGCFGSETWDIVAKVLTVSRSGELCERLPTEFESGYRHVEMLGARLGEEQWFVAGWFLLRPGDRADTRKRVEELLARRMTTQPLQLPNAGSVFRNPPGEHAARLIELCGLKGHAIGGARLSEKHANFIVNPGRLATAADIEALIGLARAEVLQRCGVDLVPEVRIIGVPA